MQKISIDLFIKLVSNLGKDVRYTIHTGWSKKYPVVNTTSLIDLLDNSTQDHIYYIFYNSDVDSALCVAISDRKSNTLVYTNWHCIRLRLY